MNSLLRKQPKCCLDTKDEYWKLMINRKTKQSNDYLEIFSSVRFDEDAEFLTDIIYHKISLSSIY